MNNYKTSKEFNILIGQKLRLMRMRAGLQQNEAAELLQTSAANLSNLELGYTTASPEMLYCACCLYGCRLTDIFPRLVSAEMEVAG